MEFAYDGGGLGKGGTVTLYVDGAGGGAAWTPRCRWCSPPTRPPTSGPTAPRRSATTSAARKRVHGQVRWVQIDIDEAAEDMDHLITPDERLRIAMARQ